MKRLATLVVIGAGLTVASAETLLNNMDMIPHGYSRANGNHEGGMLVFGKNYGLQLAQPFKTTATGFVITEVEVGNVTFGVDQPAYAVVAVYPWRDNTAVYRATHAVSKNTSFTDSVFGLFGLRSTISGLSISLSPHTDYMIAVQTIDGDWAYTVQRPGLDGFTRTRDHSSFGYQGGYGWTTWRSTWDPTEAAYRVEAIPEPAVVLLVGLGVLSLIGRR